MCLHNFTDSTSSKPHPQYIQAWGIHGCGLLVNYREGQPPYKGQHPATQCVCSTVYDSVYSSYAQPMCTHNIMDGSPDMELRS